MRIVVAISLAAFAASCGQEAKPNDEHFTPFAACRDFLAAKYPDVRYPVTTYPQASDAYCQERIDNLSWMEQYLESYLTGLPFELICEPPYDVSDRCDRWHLPETSSDYELCMEREVERRDGWAAKAREVIETSEDPKAIANARDKLRWLTGEPTVASHYCVSEASEFQDEERTDGALSLSPFIVDPPDKSDEEMVVDPEFDQDKEAEVDPIPFGP